MITSEQVLEKMKNLILKFTIHYDKLTDDEVAELRAQLSAISYMFTEKNIKETSDMVVDSEIKYEKEKVEAFNRAMKKCNNKSTIARELARADPLLLEKMHDKLESYELHQLNKTLLRQCNHVINSMAAKSRSAYRND